MRLLFCQACRTLEELPDFTPTHKDHVDPLLEELVRRHNVKDPMAHGGQETLPLSVMVVSEKDWAENRKEIIKGINDQHKKVSGATDADYVLESLDTFKYDAMTCYNRHRRPEDGCIDWMSDSKRIGRPTSEGQRAMKDLPKQSDPHLCDFCVVRSGVDTKKRALKGLYKG
jgi:hypothetical protein